MNIRQKLYQMFILGSKGGEYEKALKAGLGGIIFFTEDIKSVKQFKNLIFEIKSNALIPPFLSIDQEGGRVERTENLHGGKKYLSAKFAYEKGEEYLKKQTREIARELKSYGINLNFTPCIDVNTNPANPIIGERAFSSNVEDVIKCEKTVSKIYRENGIIPCVKHFPGHGDANTDSHLTLPEINLSLEEMERIHIKPFASAVNNGIEMIMAGHLNCACFEKDIPTSLSKSAIGYLRNKLGFNGVIISDDMMMKGVAQFGLQEAFETGIRAGLNMFIYRNSTFEIIDIIEKLACKTEHDEELIQNVKRANERILNLKTSSGIS